MDKLVTIDKIQEWLTKQIEQKLPIDGHTYMDAASKINVLLQGEQEKLFKMEQGVALMRKELLGQGDTVSAAKVIVESSDAYLEARIQKSKIERAIELIRIAKINARTANDIMRGQM